MPLNNYYCHYCKKLNKTVFNEKKTKTKKMKKKKEEEKN